MPVAPATVSVTWCCSASTWRRSTASLSTSSMSTTSGSTSGLSACSRDSSMIWPTRSVSRADSTPIRPANLRTAVGSSAASSTASASSEIAPIGVFSSWLTLATKSRRVCSIRQGGGPVVGQHHDQVVRRAARPGPRSASSRPGAPGDLQVDAAQGLLPADRPRTRSSSSGMAIRLPRTRPRVRAVLVASSTSSCGPTTTPEELSTASTSDDAGRHRRSALSKVGGWARAAGAPHEPHDQHAEDEAHDQRQRRRPRSGSQ